MNRIAVSLGRIAYGCQRSLHCACPYRTVPVKLRDETDRRFTPHLWQSEVGFRPYATEGPRP